MKNEILTLLTRTSLHIGAGASVGAIDQPIQRERHTGFPIIPATSLKGSFADQWPVSLKDKAGKLVRVTSKKEGGIHQIDQIDASGAAWLFGSDDAFISFAGSLIFSEARVIAFPIRSARGSYAWITCPLMLQRAARDGVFTGAALDEINNLKEPPDTAEQAFAMFKPNTLGLGEHKKQIVLEEYCFDHCEGAFDEIANALAKLVSDTLFATIEERLVILSNGMMSHFGTTACEIAQHVRINDQTGTAEEGGLFNQENVPADTLFYSVASATDSRVPHNDYRKMNATDALTTFLGEIKTVGVFQFGGDATTGLGFCTVAVVDDRQTPSATQNP